jgi:hypothetical protein
MARLVAQLIKEFYNFAAVIAGIITVLQIVLCETA